MFMLPWAIDNVQILLRLWCCCFRNSWKFCQLNAPQFVSWFWCFCVLLKRFSLRLKRFCLFSVNKDLFTWAWKSLCHLEHSLNSIRNHFITITTIFSSEIEVSIKGRKLLTRFHDFSLTMNHYFVGRDVLFLEPFNNQHISGVFPYLCVNDRASKFIFGEHKPRIWKVDFWCRCSTFFLATDRNRWSSIFNALIDFNVHIKR